VLQLVSQWQTKVETSQPDVIRVLAEERQEKELRKAEMEATKVGGWVG
jgi:ATP-dependent RNA helicase DDX27